MEQKTVTVFCYAPMCYDRDKYDKEKFAMTNYFIRYATGIYELKKYCDLVDPDSYDIKKMTKDGRNINDGGEQIINRSTSKKKSAVSIIEEIMAGCEKDEDIINAITENVRFIMFNELNSYDGKFVSAKTVQEEQDNFMKTIRHEYYTFKNRQFPLSYIQENADIIVLTKKANKYVKNNDSESVSIFNIFLDNMPIMMIDI